MFFVRKTAREVLKLKNVESISVITGSGVLTPEPIFDDTSSISVGTEMKMYFKYGQDWEKKTKKIK